MSDKKCVGAIFKIHFVIHDSNVIVIESLLIFGFETSPHHPFLYQGRFMGGREFPVKIRRALAVPTRCGRELDPDSELVSRGWGRRR